MTPPSDDTRAETDSEHRVAKLLEEFGPLIRQAVSHTCPRSLAIASDEIEQAARLRLWRALQRETEIRNPPSYIFRVVATATIDAIREIRTRREIPLPPEGRDDEMPVAKRQPRPSPERATILNDAVGHVYKALSTLPKRRQRAVTLHLRGWTNREIGDQLGWSEAMVRNLVHRGMKDLRKLLAPLSLDREQRLYPLSERAAGDI